MKNKIKYHWGKEDLLIELGNRTEPRIKIIFWGELLITCGMATIFLLRSFQIQENIIAFFLSLGACVLYVLATYRFISRMYFQEKITITNTDLTILRQTPFYKKSVSYNWENMGSLHYIGNPSKGKCVDNSCFNPQEKLMQNLHPDGNLFFEYKGVEVRFARGIYSWHAEEIVCMIKLFSGASLKLGEEWEYLMEEDNFEW